MSALFATPSDLSKADDFLLDLREACRRHSRKVESLSTRARDALGSLGLREPFDDVLASVAALEQHVALAKTRRPAAEDEREKWGDWFASQLLLSLAATCWATISAAWKCGFSLSRLWTADSSWMGPIGVNTPAVRLHLEACDIFRGICEDLADRFKAALRKSSSALADRFRGQASGVEAGLQELRREDWCLLQQPVFSLNV